MVHNQFLAASRASASETGEEEEDEDEEEEDVPYSAFSSSSADPYVQLYPCFSLYDVYGFCCC
jgi:hypothetical protein